MTGTRVFVIALLLCAVAVGGAAIVASDTAHGPLQVANESDRPMSVVTVQNSSAYLAPQPGVIDRTEKRTVGLDVAGAIEADSGELRSVYIHETLQRQYQNADSDTDRRIVLERGAAQLSERTTEIETKERRAIRQFNDGSVSEYELLRTLSTVHREAEATREALEWLETTADDHGIDDLREQAATEQIRLMPMDGPVRAQVTQTFERGTTSRVYVETVDEGVILSTVSPRGTYLREAHDPTAKRADTSDQYGGNPSPALDRFTELYPWAINSFDGIDAIGPAQVRLYRFGASHPHGTLETYLDSGSTEILYEKQWLDPGSMPTTVYERTEGDLRLIVNTTRAGGPLGVSVVDTTTDEPVNAAIELNDESIGSTGGDRLWTVAPRGTTTVNATYNDETVTLDTSLR